VGQRLTRAPVYFALAQVRFNPVLALDSYIPQMQDQLRKQGYPDVKKTMLSTFNLNFGTAPQGNAPAQVPVTLTARYIFSNIDKTQGFILDQGALAFHATEYDTFESFEETLLIGLKIVHDAVSLSYTDRIGVRYLDAVYPKSDETLSVYLKDFVLGLYGQLSGTLIHSFSETVLQRNNSRVVARIILQDGVIGFAADLLPIELQVPERFRSLRGLHAILDTDGSRENRHVFDLAHVKHDLTIVHEDVIDAFKAIVTERALRIWE
jgi:uncharacterized protein (TIGR04255 family)